MKSLIFIFLGLISAVHVYGASTICPPKPTGMSDEMYDFLLESGGWYDKPGTGQGYVQIVNRQTKVSASKFEEPILTIQADVPIKILVVTEQCKDAQITIELVDTSTDKSLVVYPDECRAVVNIAPLTKDNPSQEKLDHRVCKSIVRAFGYVGGATGGTAGNAMDIMTTLSRLDAAEAVLPGHYVLQCDAFLSRCGVKKYERCTYLDACQRGFAPQPTNDFQNAIWEKVHAPPSKPIKITYDKDKQKPVVK